MTLTHNLSHFVETITWPLTHKSITHFFFFALAHISCINLWSKHDCNVNVCVNSSAERFSSYTFHFISSICAITIHSDMIDGGQLMKGNENDVIFRLTILEICLCVFFFCVSRTFWLWTFDAVEYRVWSHVELCGSRLIRFKVNGIIWLTMFHFIIFRWNLCGFGCRIGFWYFLSQYLLKHSIHAQKSFFYWRFFVLLNTWSSQIELNWVRQS